MPHRPMSTTAAPSRGSGSGTSMTSRRSLPVMIVACTGRTLVIALRLRDPGAQIVGRSQGSRRLGDHERAERVEHDRELVGPLRVDRALEASRLWAVDEPR